MVPNFPPTMRNMTPVFPLGKRNNLVMSSLVEPASSLKPLSQPATTTSSSQPVISHDQNSAPSGKQYQTVPPPNNYQPAAAKQRQNQQPVTSPDPPNPREKKFGKKIYPAKIPVKVIKLNSKTMSIKKINTFSKFVVCL